MSSFFENSKNTKMHISILVIIVVIGAFLRFTGTDFGLPIQLHPDEAIVADEAARLAGERSFETKTYYRPNHTSIKANALIYMFIDDIRYHSENAEAFQETYTNHIRPFYLASRLLSALLSTLCIIIAYIIGIQFKPSIGLLSAGLFAVFPSFVLHAHYITPESIQLFFLLLVSLFAILYIKKQSLIYLCLMSIMAAFAICEKYPSGYFCLTIAFSIIYAHHQDIKTLLKRATLAVTIYASSIFLISPVLLLDYHNVFEAIKGENHAFHPGADSLNTFGNLLYYFVNFYEKVGIIISLLTVVGIYCCIKKYRSSAVVLLLGCLYIVPLAFTNLHWERWGVPMYAHMLFFSAVGIFYTFQFLRNKITSSNFKPNIIKLLSGILITAVFVLPFFSMFSTSLARMFFFMTPHTRVVAREYCDQNDITMANTLSEGYTPLQPTYADPIFERFEDYDITKPNAKNISYAIISSAMYDRYYAEPERFVREVAFYESLKANCSVKQVFEKTFMAYGSPIEPVSIAEAFSVISKFLNGGNPGDTIIIYELPS